MSDTTDNHHSAELVPELRVAIVGAGPAGFYSALELIDASGVAAHVDMFDRLPSPYGLVRYGVAPDHQKIKSVIKVYERAVESHAGKFRLFGNVDLGTDIKLDELQRHYHAVILSFGAQSDRDLGIPGEGLPEVYAAREFVAWYNSHPDFNDAAFDLSGNTAVIVGIGNVAIDVARILVRTPGELAKTDISRRAEDALRLSTIQKVIVMARRGPLQAACTPVELREMTEMEGASLVVDPQDMELDPVSAAELAEGTVPTQNQKVYAILKGHAGKPPEPGKKVIHLRFSISPTEIIGAEHVKAVRVRRNRLVESADGTIVADPTPDTELIPASVVFRSIGYRVAPVPGVPFDAAKSRIPHVEGQVLDTAGAPIPGLFAAGWAKRGPSGVIGTNKPDAAETVRTLMAAFGSGGLPAPSGEDVTTLLAERGVEVVSYDDWKLLDNLEIEAGVREGRPRVKFPDVQSMLAALAKVT